MISPPVGRDSSSVLLAQTVDLTAPLLLLPEMLLYCEREKRAKWSMEPGTVGLRDTRGRLFWEQAKHIPVRMAVCLPLGLEPSRLDTCTQQRSSLGSSLRFLGLML